MGYTLKGVLFLYLIVNLVIQAEISYEELLLFLIIIAIQIWKERYYNSIYLSIGTLAFICIAVPINPAYSVLFAVVLYDFIIYTSISGALITCLLAIFFSIGDILILKNSVILIVSGLLAYGVEKRNKESETYLQTLDNERRLRYELEQTKAKLLHSSKEIANIVEIKERNRIAREIHDSIGHSLAGILIQLQAAYKLHDQDETKSMMMIQKSIKGLSESVELLRNTVHNLKPRENVSIEYIHNIIDNFSFCPVQLKFLGDFSKIPASHLEIVSTNIKEALTNAAKYSQATNIQVNIDVNEQYTRLYIKDNGVGCDHITEGLGLSGMRERIRNVGGSLSLSSKEGFLIVCLIPNRDRSGVFESLNSG
ncbi:sensor histidine kinase [Bacillus carboniphilus]|uniref:histidine kinase n=1 Tax=Bacillus carboniphilus TaxID=86663 RepID=A0ABP3G438_9BACI